MSVLDRPLIVWDQVRGLRETGARLPSGTERMSAWLLRHEQLLWPVSGPMRVGARLKLHGLGVVSKLVTVELVVGAAGCGCLLFVHSAINN